MKNTLNWRWIVLVLVFAVTAWLTEGLGDTSARAIACMGTTSIAVALMGDESV